MKPLVKIIEWNQGVATAELQGIGHTDGSLTITTKNPFTNELGKIGIHHITEIRLDNQQVQFLRKFLDQHFAEPCQPKN